MTKFDTLIKFKDGSHMYIRDHKIAFENARKTMTTEKTKLLSICDGRRIYS
jgi:hypothetical protein